MLKRLDVLWYEAESDKNNKKLFDSLDDCFVNGNAAIKFLYFIANFVNFN